MPTESSLIETAIGAVCTLIAGLGMFCMRRALRVPRTNGEQLEELRKAIRKMEDFQLRHEEWTIHAAHRLEAVELKVDRVERVVTHLQGSLGLAP